MPCNGDCNQGRECNCDLDAKRITELEARNKELVEALEGVTDSLGGNYEQHAIRKRIQDLLGEVK
jgi:hypothetical protein